MNLCYWGKCTCPQLQPCEEHHGNHCGLWNGIQVSRLGQVVDALTRDTEAAIVRMTQDEATLDAMITTLEQRKADLEQEKRDLEAAFNGANSIAKRRAAIALGRQAQARFTAVQQEVITTTNQLDAITRGWQTAFGRMSVRLITPYTDPNGYCDCFAQKQANLAAVNTQITTATAQWNAYNREKNLYQSNLTIIVRAPFTIALVLGIWAYIIFGLGAALIKAIFVILLVIAILVLALLIRIVWIVKAMAALSRQILGFQLTYYRMQSIGTCLQFQGDPPAYGSHWWQEMILGELPAGVLPEKLESPDEDE